ncbi:MAG: hypothetical protein ABI760_09220 [Ferruginibacter sp.]
MPTEYYPSLSSLITLDDLPQELEFIDTVKSAVLDEIYFRDLQFTRSPKGDSAYYSMVLILNRSVGFTIPGADIKIALSPDFATGTTTEIPVTLEYEWKLLSLLKKITKFTTEGFSGDGKAFFDLLTDVTGLTEEGMLNSALQQFVGSSEPLAAVNIFIDHANTKYHTSVPHTTETEIAGALAEALITVSLATAKDPFSLIYEIYIEDVSATDVLDKVKVIFAPLLEIDPIQYIKEMLIPKINATLSLSQDGIGIIFPRKYLVPLDVDDQLKPFPQTGADTDKMSILGFGVGKFSFSTVSGFGYDEQLTAKLNYPSMIGDTGLIIDLQNAKLDLSRVKNIPEATEDGRPEDFMGVYIQEVSVTLPEKWFKQADHTTAKIYGRRFLIGTGGVSGEIGLEATAAGQQLPIGEKPAVKTKLGEDGGFELAFEKFSLTFKQNAITACDISGYMKIKGFKDADGHDAQIDIKVSISANGDFNITASEEQGISLIKIPDIFDINIRSLSVGRKNEKFFVAISGELDFFQTYLPKNIEIQKLLIYQDGSYELEGGGIVLRKPLTLKIGPVELSITGIHMGSYEKQKNGTLRKYKFFGFDGGISVKPGGVDARGDGIKFYFSVDNGPLDFFVRIQSIAVDLMIPGDAKKETAALIMKGYLAMKDATGSAGNSDAGTEYAGAIELTLPKLKIAGSAAMRFNPGVPSFIIDAGLELSTPLLLGSTGLGIYGFRGLFGLRYVASREYVGLAPDAEWWQYYKKKVGPENREGIFFNKMEQKEGFSIGAGISVCTMPDSGKTFSTKLFFMLSLPEVFLLQGQAAFLKERIGLNDPNDPPFYAVISISSTSIETAVGVNYKMPDSGDQIGKIVKVDGMLELAFFWGNGFGWYLNLGKDTPEDRRIKARIFDLFDCYFFLMISSNGIYTGGGASYSFSQQYLEIINVSARAYMDIRGKISFKPFQIGASIQLGASLQISVLGVSFAISGDAGLAAEAPKPFIISGFIRVSITVLFTTFNFKVDFTVNFTSELDVSEIPLLDDDTTKIANAINAHTKEIFPVYVQKLSNGLAPMPTAPWAGIESFTIPQDSFIDIEFKQGINAIGGDPSLANFNDITGASEFTVLVPPQPGKSSQVKHEFYLEKIELKIWDKTAGVWLDYHPYKAMSSLADLPGFDLGGYPSFDKYIESKGFKFGSWQVRQPNRYNTLRVLATNPFSFTTQGIPFIPEESHITSKTIFCPDPPRENVCIELSALGRPDASGTTNYVPANQNIILEGVLFRITGKDGKIINQPYANVNSALKLQARRSYLEILFPDAIPYVSLTLQITTGYVEIAYFKRVQTGLDTNQMPVFDWQLVELKSRIAQQVAEPVVFENADSPIGKISIYAGDCSSKWVYQEFDDKIESLKDFLNALLITGRIGNGRVINISSGIYRQCFTGILPEGDLGTNMPQSDLYVKSAYNNDGTIFIEIFSKKEPWRCEIKLTAPGKTNLSEYLFTRFLNLRPDPGINAPAYSGDFLVDAEFMKNGTKRMITLAGESCFDLRWGDHYGISDTLNLTTACINLQTFLQELAQHKKLVQSRRLNITSGKYASEFINIITPGLFDSKGADLYYEAEQVSINDIDIQVYFNDQRQYISLETINMGPAGFSIDAIDSFENIRANPQKTGTETRHFFLIDAIYSQQRLSLSGETNIDIFWKVRGSGPGSQLPRVELQCGGLTPEATALEGFLSVLGSLLHLTSSKPIRLADFPEYTNTYFSTPLFINDGGATREDTWQLRSASAAFDETDYILTQPAIKGAHSCRFYLRAVSDGFFVPDLRELTNLHNLQPTQFSEEDGITYNFKAQGDFISAKGNYQAEVLGSSCYPTGTCEDNCVALLYKCCYLSKQDHQFNSTIPDITIVDQHNQAMVEAMSKLLPPIWRPQSVFGIRIQTRDRLSATIPAGTGGALPDYSNAYFIGFKTAGPPGHFHEYIDFNGADIVREDYGILQQADKEDEYKLQSLKYYVDMEKSYPNADGRLTLAKPLFYRAPKLLLFYAEDYVYLMYNDWAAYNNVAGWDSRIQATITDPVDNPLNPSVFYVDAAWEKNEVPIIKSDESILGNFQDNGVICTTTSRITKMGVNVSFTAPELKPLKTYHAQFNALFKPHDQSHPDFVSREVHQYVFATSQYPGFTEQVNSYLTVTEHDPVTKAVYQGKALYNIGLNLENADILRIQSVLANTDPDTLKIQFIHLYDRLMTGGFKMPSQEPPMVTEFNTVRNNVSQQIAGILVRNPEPFNDPKIPLPILDAQKVIELSVNGGASNQFTCIYSRDLSCIFITNNDHSLNMPTGTYSFTFRYLEYDADAKDYRVVTTIAGITFDIL